MARALRGASDASMPRARARRTGGRKTAYWWTEGIAEARRTVNTVRRRLLRARKKLRGGAETEETEGFRRIHKESKDTLRKYIKRAKREAWVELIKSVDEDP